MEMMGSKKCLAFYQLRSRGSGRAGLGQGYDEVWKRQQEMVFILIFQAMEIIGSKKVFGVLASAARIGPRRAGV